MDSRIEETHLTLHLRAGAKAKSQTGSQESFGVRFCGSAYLWIYFKGTHRAIHPMIVNLENLLELEK